MTSKTTTRTGDYRVRAYRGTDDRTPYTQEFTAARDAVEVLTAGRDCGEFCGGDIDVWVEGIGWVVWEGTYA